MTASSPASNLGRHLYGVAALAFGLITLIWPDYKNLGAPPSIVNAGDGAIIVYVVAAAYIIGGVAIQFGRTAKTGAVILGAVYLLFSLVCVPAIVAAPLVFGGWGNFFEPFSLVVGAAIVYARLSSAWTPETVRAFGRVLWAICTASFALYQAFYLPYTASLVPKWVPPGQMFWAVATTVAFALAVVALLTNRMALLATRLLTIMLVLFGLLVWVPILFSSPHSFSNWNEFVETMAIAGASWIIVDLLGARTPTEQRAAA
jgi:hypothetical protein